MADFNSAIMTDAGAELLAYAQAGIVKIKFLSIDVGSGTYSESEMQPQNLRKMKSLKSWRANEQISSMKMISPTCSKITSVFTNQDTEEGYYITEVGLFAINENYPQSGPILYSIAVAKKADFMPAYNGSAPCTLQQEFYATVSNTATVTIEADSLAFATAEDLAETNATVISIQDTLGGLGTLPSSAIDDICAGTYSGDTTSEEIAASAALSNDELNELLQ